ncbi:MAG: dUTP diphosphatase [Acidobacteriota bacterium]
MCTVPAEPLRVKLSRLPGNEDLPLPAYATQQSAGADLRAAVATARWLAPGQRALIPTGFRLALPAGYEAQVRPRSGRALREGLTLLNSPGTIDADYRGELRILVVNHGRRPLLLKRGDRIAQLIIAPVSRVAFEEVGRLPETPRGAGGFGHTGD